MISNLIEPRGISWSSSSEYRDAWNLSW